MSRPMWLNLCWFYLFFKKNLNIRLECMVVSYLYFCFLYFFLFLSNFRHWFRSHTKKVRLEDHLGWIVLSSEKSNQRSLPLRIAFITHLHSWQMWALVLSLIQVGMLVLSLFLGSHMFSGKITCLASLHLGAEKIGSVKTAISGLWFLCIVRKSKENTCFKVQRLWLWVYLC